MILNHAQEVFSLQRLVPADCAAPVRRSLLRQVERALGLNILQRRYSQLPSTATIEGFLDLALKELDVRWTCDAEQRDRIPTSGGAIVVANHPFGGLEGVVLAQMLLRLRPDVRIMANYMLSSIPELAELFIGVDPFDGANSARANVAPMRQAVKWVKDGGLLLVFPAGEVSHLHVRRRRVLDPDWSSTVGRMVRMTKVPVVPLFIEGRNRSLFQLAGLVHPRLRTLMLPRELLNKQGQTMRLRIGKPLTYRKKLERFEDDQRLVDYLRLKTYLLGEDRQETLVESPPADAGTDIIPPVALDVLKEEIARLPEEQRLARSGEMTVYGAEAIQIPHLLLEIGRLRETTFRLVGEGTGQSVDLDTFDREYVHLFIWNDKKDELVGAYRVGHTDELLQDKGLEKLYTSTLFKYKQDFLQALGPALEMGRSFVREEYQRSYAPLLLLWKGIGAYVVKNPKYRYLFGPVSISRDYSDLSRNLIASSLLKHEREEGLSRLVRPKNPPKLKKLKVPGARGKQTDVWGQDLDELAALVDGLEEDKSLPVLLRHYLGLGGKLLAFNVDQDFASVLDGLILVDLVKTDRKQLDRYMTPSGAEAFLAFQNNGRALWDDRG